MVDAYRVVGGLRQLVQDAHAAARHGSGGEYGSAEILFADGLRTGECEKYASRFDFLESFDVEFPIALQSVAQGIAVLGKCWRVQNDKVVLVAHAVKVFKGILCIGCMTVVAGKVQFDILVGQVDGFGRAVYGMYQCGIAAHGVNRKTAGIAEHVQHTAAVGIAFQQ